MRLDGRRTLLTGATGGLGRSIAEALAERGARLVLSSRKPDELERLAASLPGAGHAVVVGDLAVEGEALRVLEAAGEIDVLVANAGLPASGRLETYSPQNMERALRVNLESPVTMARELVERLRERGEGHLVFMSSLAGRAPTARASLYCATKFGLRGFALALREDLRGTGVGVSVVMPGLIRDAGMFADSRASTPVVMGSATPAQVASAVVRAIERDRAEIAVAPLRQRLLSLIAANAPELAGRVAGATSVAVADKVAAGQSNKR